MHLTVDILSGRMVEVTEEVGDAPIVDVATDYDKLLLVVHLHKKKEQSTLLLIGFLLLKEAADPLLQLTNVQIVLCSN